MLDWIVLLKPECYIMIGNHYVNMAHYVTQPLEDGDETQTQVETTCQIYTDAWMHVWASHTSTVMDGTNPYGLFDLQPLLWSDYTLSVTGPPPSSKRPSFLSRNGYFVYTRSSNHRTTHDGKGWEKDGVTSHVLHGGKKAFNISSCS